MQFATGFLLALGISLVAYAARRLTLGGAIAAVLLGTVTYGLGGWRAAAIVITFFASSTILESIVKPANRVRAGTYAKTGQRDAGQVLANGMTGVLFLLPSLSSPAPMWSWIGFSGSVAAATADTWATELGILSRGAPRLITRLSQRAARGTSGAVSIFGTLAAALGAALISSMAAVLAPSGRASVVFPVAFGGLVGTLLDSYLGATLQAVYLCTTEGVETEQHPIHVCGSPTRRIRGLPWLNNDLVNLACALTGAGTACLMARAFGLQ